MLRQQGFHQRHTGRFLLRQCVSEISDRANESTDVAQSNAIGNFHLPAFVRYTFVGETQRAIWQPRLEAVHDALARLGVEAVRQQIVPSMLLSVAPTEVFAIHNLAAGYDLHTCLLGRSECTRRELMVVGHEQTAMRYQQAWKGEHEALLDVLAGVPSCCQQAHQQQSAYRDRAWFSITAQQTITGNEADIQGPAALNMLLKPLDISLLSYWPCHLHCEASLRLADSLIALGREAGMGEAMDWLLALLDWPAEWSALHGIAELKTGVLKCAYDTDFTGEKLTMRYHGRTLPAEAVRGLSFAYRNPERRRRSLNVHTVKRQVIV